jgi:hypothetical protein
MPLTFACPCGQQLEVDDQYAGMPVSCPTCNAVVNAPARRRAVAIAIAPPPRPVGSKNADPGYEVVESRPRKQRAQVVDEDDEERPRRRRRDEDEDEDEEERPRRKRLNKSQEPPKHRSLEGRVFNGGMKSGAIAMLVAVVWLVVGLAAGWFFFYPPILFVIGLIGFIRGMVARNSD